MDELSNVTIFQSLNEPRNGTWKQESTYQYHGFSSYIVQDTHCLLRWFVHRINTHKIWKISHLALPINGYIIKL